MNSDSVEIVMRVAEALRKKREEFEYYASELEGAVGNDSDLEVVDRIAEMPINYQPTHSLFRANFGDANFGDSFWPIRGSTTLVRGVRTEVPKRITGLTIHHTMSHSPLATARYCTATKGYPTVQYHYWVSQGDGCPIYQLADESWAMWHDNTGSIQTTLSIGMAGSLHLKRPPDEQLDATVAIVHHLMDKHGLDVEDVKGHRERWNLNTQCPGWGPTDRSQRSWGSGWKEDFYNRIKEE